MEKLVSAAVMIGALTPCMLGNFSCLFSRSTVSKIISECKRYVGPVLDPNCLQRYSSDVKSHYHQMSKVTACMERVERVHMSERQRYGGNYLFFSNPGDIYLANYRSVIKYSCIRYTVSLTFID